MEKQEPSSVPTTTDPPESPKKSRQNMGSQQLWSEFLETWPVDRVRGMSLEEYTNLNRDDAFVYWLETRTEDLGSIWGGSAFKFGIYRREQIEPKEPKGGRIWGDEFGWMRKYGETAEEAFATVRSRLVEIVESVRTGNLEAVDEVDFSPVVKWKVAFLYQDRENPRIFNIYKKDWLLFHYKQLDPSSKDKDVPYSVLYTTLIDHYRNLGGVFEIGSELWRRYHAEQKAKPTYWVVPLARAFSEEGAAETLCAKPEVTTEDVDPVLDKLLADSKIAAGDRVAFLVDDRAHALAEITNAELGDFSWKQVAVDTKVSLVPLPTSEARKLTAAEANAIWGRRPGNGGGVKPPPAWKIAPGEGARFWDSWKTEGHVSIGWSLLGDLTGCDRAAIEERIRQAAAEDPDGYKPQGLEQLRQFLQIPVGARIVANRGKSRILGIGTVTGPYFHSPGHEYPHRLPVGWDWVGDLMLAAPRHDWQWTVRKLGPEDFAALEATVLAAPPGKPKNIVLYGPPGTGKTYSTVKRALELVLGEPKVRAMSQDTRARQFRRLQQEGRIEFVTFHQAYGYEEFVEGIRPVLGTGDDHEIRYELHEGVFKRIARRAAGEGLKSPRREEPSFEALWRQLVNIVASEEDRFVESYTGKTYVLRTTSRGNLETIPCELDEEGAVVKVGETRLLASKASVRLVWEHRRELGLEPSEVTQPKTTRLFAQERGGGGGHHYTAIWIVYGELLGLARAGQGRPTAERDRLERVQEVLDKPTSGAVDFRFTTETPQYALVIDEINRGNVSKILGELITLLEPDKRLATPGELKLPLSYSPDHRFAVPPNLHVLGTMNTADRSIALMDVALRRRFTFEEMMPDSGVLRSILPATVKDEAFVDLVVDLMETLNRRIRFIYDRDHQIGHSYLLEAFNYEELRQVFVDRLVPLLQEYFYGAWDKICTVLGCPVDESGKPLRTGPSVDAGSYVAPIVLAEVFAEEATLGFDHDDYEDRLDFRVAPELSSRQSDQEKLLPFFLGVLDLTESEQSSRLQQLKSGPLLDDSSEES